MVHSTQNFRNWLRTNRADKAKLRWVSNKDRAEATLKLSTLVPEDVTAIVGVARSGLSSAMQIAELHHLFAYSINMKGELIKLSSGFRMRGEEEKKGKLFIVDDTTAGGHTIARIKQHKLPAHYMAVTYASPGTEKLLDFYAEIYPLPHYLEWNFFNSVHIPKSAVDFDGILCEDCTREADDDGVKYEKFLANVRPKYLVRRKVIPLIITGRLEKYRSQTIAWLNKWGIKYEKLVMGSWSNKNERERVGEYKANEFKKTSLEIFVESCPKQAKIIAEISKRTVICPQTGEVL